MLSIFNLAPVFKAPLLKPFSFWASKWLGIDKLNDHLAQLQKKHPDDERALIEEMPSMYKHDIRFVEEQLANIPKTGPCIIVANHPTDLLDQLTITNVLSKVRRDYKFTANSQVEKFGLWNNIVFMLCLNGESDTAKQNFKSIRGAIDWLNAGHVLITYPSARPSSLSKKARNGRKKWSSLPVMLSQKAGAPIVSMRITLKEPLHHRLLKRFIRVAYGLLALRVLSYFSGKPITLTVGEAFYPPKEKLDKRQAGEILENSVSKLAR
jgi:1-acyl-sn-glycerol-3-phosphate acyltransferase